MRPGGAGRGRGWWARRAVRPAGGRTQRPVGVGAGIGLEHGLGIVGVVQNKAQEGGDASVRVGPG